ncbi:MAG: low temperature requirement protein A [Nonomuraea sp.]|nr:low temperature requirement protein A [Nonomuraea sp.]NUP63282.1 low temperature requirement protein A [Nonomuraea sp.]NUP82677.1 low temperature requirement protein A [Nonomuraea sp.]NUT10415.1 low temperature requirement protein A [Nonomuraea sp.]
MTVLRPMRARDAGESHRTATNLELFFDLCFVVAVSFAGAQLHHALSEGHLGEGVAGYLTTFFAIWWAWMNYTWFASAYDNDDWLFRVTTLVQMSGVLVLAAGVPRAFQEHDFLVVYLGYLIMRLAMAAHWLRAASGDRAGRRTALRYAAGICVAQIGWIVLLLAPERWYLAAFALGVVLELSVPVWAERATSTAWHPHHIAERYGLFTIIMMGENVLAATAAVQAEASGAGLSPGLITLALGALVIAFAMWWLYFAPPAHEILLSNRQAIPWGYGHYLIFAAVGAFSAGVEVGIDYKAGAAHLSHTGAALTVSVPVAVFLFMVWVLHVRPHGYGRADSAAFLGATALVLLAALTPVPIPLIAAVMVALVLVTGATRRDRQSSTSAMLG